MLRRARRGAPGGAGVARRAGAVVRGDRAGAQHSGRHGDVAALARPVGAQAAPGGEERGEDMNHLTDDQLSARLDDALSTVERASFDAHLATCAECRERLASIGTLDRSLAAALEHDPGEEYF